MMWTFNKNSAFYCPSTIMTLSPTLITLDALPVGQSGTVVHIAPGGPDVGIDVARRLMELGFVPGEPIRIALSRQGMW